MDFPKRKAPRLKDFDYSQDGYYFITICTNKRCNILSKIVGQGLAPAGVQLSEYGLIVKEQLMALEERYPTIKVDKYIIMPNHIHAIIVVDSTVEAVKTAGASPRPTVSDAVCTFKSLAARKIRQAGYKEQVFQSSFHDHIIRNKRDYQQTWSYIDGNAAKWEEDELNTVKI